MITQIYSLPDNMIGFKATGEVTADDFKDVVIPKVTEFVKQHDKINYLLVLDTDISKLTYGAWLQDAWMGIKDLLKWNKAAIVTDNETVKKVTDIFNKVTLGDFRVFKHEEYEQAVAWANQD